MKLRSISENFLAAKLRDALASNGYFNRPLATTDQPYMPSTGTDGQNAGMSELPSGLPRRSRHRTYLGLEKRPGAIRL